MRSSTSDGDPPAAILVLDEMVGNVVSCPSALRDPDLTLRSWAGRLGGIGWGDEAVSFGLRTGGEVGLGRRRWIRGKSPILTRIDMMGAPPVSCTGMGDS
jgi:hypothetical protein